MVARVEKTLEQQVYRLGYVAGKYNLRRVFSPHKPANELPRLVYGILNTVRARVIAPSYICPGLGHV